MAWLQLYAKFGGRCALCGGRVQAGQRINWSQDTRETRHALAADCQVAAVAAEPAASALDVSQLPSGRYLAGGVTFMVDNLHDTEGESRWADYVFVRTLDGAGRRQRCGYQRPDRDEYQGDNEVQLAEVLKDPRAAAVAFGRTTGRCAICGRLLTDESSVAQGIGPICIQRFAA